MPKQALRRALVATGTGLIACLVVAPRVLAQASIGEILEEYHAIQNSALEAAHQSQSGDKAGAIATLQDALARLEALAAALPQPSVAEQLGAKLQSHIKRLGGLENKFEQALFSVESDKKASVTLRRLRAASKASNLAVDKYGAPVLGLASPMDTTAGFHKPGEKATFMLHGGACQGPLVVEAVNTSPFDNPIDVASLTVDEATGLVTVTMGYEQGGGYVSVSGCGQTTKHLLYNYGPKIPKSLPSGFPTNLTPGTYQILVSGSGLPPTSYGTIQLKSLGSFAKAFMKALDDAVAAVSYVPGCSAGTSYSTFDGNAFSATVTVTCSFGGQSATVSVTLSVTKV